MTNGFVAEPDRELWPIVLEWLAWFKIDAEAHERMRGEAEERARVQSRADALARDPYALGRP